MKKKILFVCMLCSTLFAYAQKEYFNEEEKIAFEQNKTEILSRLKLLKEDKLMEITSKYKIDEEYLWELEYIIDMQESRKICYDYIYPDDKEKRWKGKTSVENDYKNPIFQIIFLSGNDVTSPNLHILAKYKQSLELTPSQINEVTIKAIEHKAILDKNPRRDLWRNELEFLQDALTEEQLDLFFMQKNSEKVLRNAKVFWNRLKEFDMTNDLDSTVSVRQIYMHQMKIQKASDLYAYDDIKKREAWSAIDQNAPLPMRRVYSVSRKNIMKKQSYRGSYNW